jgi:hypothetical protein
MSLRAVYIVGKTYAVQPGHGQKAAGRILITDICREDVRYISDADVRAEGYESAVDFWLTWCEMHDKRAIRGWMNRANTEQPVREWLKEICPAAPYDAWVLSFEVV